MPNFIDKEKKQQNICKSSFNPFVIQNIDVFIDTILQAKKQNIEADTSAWEKEIDQLVYKLYNLTEEEIKIIES